MSNQRFSKYNRALGCMVNKLSYDFVARKGQLRLPGVERWEHKAVIRLFELIDPNVSQVWIFLGGCVAAVYRRQTKGTWLLTPLDFYPTGTDLNRLKVEALVYSGDDSSEIEAQSRFASPQERAGADG
jgi:hypothetical protein